MGQWNDERMLNDICTKYHEGPACEGKVVSTCSEEEHQKNRRTEFIITKMK